MRKVIELVEGNPRTWLYITGGAALISILALVFVFNAPTKEEVLNKPGVGLSGKVLDELSEPSQRQLVGIMSKDKMILGVQAVSISLIKNQRRTIFFHGIPELQATWDEYLTRRNVNPPAVFASAAQQNDRVAKILNGAFDCRPFKATINYTYFPAADAIAPWVCSISVPPGFDGSGDFTGFLTFYLPREPSDTDQKRIVKAAAEIAKDIYRRDVENTPVK